MRLALDLAGDPAGEELAWRNRDASEVDKIDANRATEDGAEAVALGIVGRYRPRWRLVRRLQSRRRERADWLFAIEPAGVSIVLEISGTDTRRSGEAAASRR